MDISCLRTLSLSLSLVSRSTCRVGVCEYVKNGGARGSFFPTTSLSRTVWSRLENKWNVGRYIQVATCLGGEDDESCEGAADVYSDVGVGLDPSAKVKRDDKAEKDDSKATPDAESEPEVVGEVIGGEGLVESLYGRQADIVDEFSVKNDGEADESAAAEPPVIAETSSKK